jgi:hypothetical protein
VQRRGKKENEHEQAGPWGRKPGSEGVRRSTAKERRAEMSGSFGERRSSVGEKSITWRPVGRSWALWIVVHLKQCPTQNKQHRCLYRSICEKNKLHLLLFHGMLVGKSTTACVCACMGYPSRPSNKSVPHILLLPS